MFKEKSPDLEDGDFESRESLLPEEQGEPWTQEDDFDICDDWVTTILKLSILGIFFLSGILFGMMWHGDLDSRCSQHVSQYCESIQPRTLSSRLLIALSSAGDERGRNHIPPSKNEQPTAEGDDL